MKSLPKNPGASAHDSIWLADKSVENNTETSKKLVVLQGKTYIGQSRRMKAKILRPIFGSGSSRVHSYKTLALMGFERFHRLVDEFQVTRW